MRILKNKMQTNHKVESREEEINEHVSFTQKSFFNGFL